MSADPHINEPTLSHFALTEQDVQHALGKVKVRDVDYADLYFESRIAESVSMEEGIVKRGAKSIAQGVGVRATAGEKTGFAYSDDLSRRDLEMAADTARYIARSPQDPGAVPVARSGKPTRDLYPMQTPLTEIATRERVALLNLNDQEARR
ncbi:MAG: PmbA/TldA family metallopeptidase [Nitrospirales bacterium]